MRIKSELEYTLNCSPKVLFSRLYTADGLCEWFADNVSVKNNIYTFTWGKWSATAKLVSIKENKSVRFEWDDHTEDAPHYFEFKINVEELSGSLALIIKEIAHHENREDAENLWDAHICNLKRVLGS